MTLRHTSSVNPDIRSRMTKKDFLMSQMRAVTAALSVPLSSVITPFEGDPRKFKQWLKEVGKYALMSGKPEHEIPMLGYVTSKGSVGDFIKRYLDETAAAEEVASWHNLRASLQIRFAEITDPQHALAVMRRTRHLTRACNYLPKDASTLKDPVL